MPKLNQFYPIVIQDFEELNFHLTEHGQNYNELVYIYNGKGNHVINHIKIPYQTGDLFVISPADEHFFDIEESTRIIAVKFTDDYLKGIGKPLFHNVLNNDLSSIMNNRILKETKLKFEQRNALVLRKTIENLLAFKEKKNLLSSSIVFYELMVVFAIIAETMHAMDIVFVDDLPAKSQLTAYLHKYIYEPEKLKIKNIASNFNISPTYFSAYFKRNFEMSYQQYLNQYKMTFIDERLRTKQLSLSQIAEMFGFSDESHFSHFYKKRKGITPSFFVNKATG